MYIYIYNTNIIVFDMKQEDRKKQFGNLKTLYDFSMIFKVVSQGIVTDL